MWLKYFALFIVLNVFHVIAYASDCVNLEMLYDKPFSKESNFTVNADSIYVPVDAEYLARGLAVAISEARFEEELNKLFLNIEKAGEGNVEKSARVAALCDEIKEISFVNDAEKKKALIEPVKQEGMSQYKAFLNQEVMKLNIYPVVGCGRMAKILFELYGKDADLREINIMYGNYVKCMDVAIKQRLEKDINNR